MKFSNISKYTVTIFNRSRRFLAPIVGFWLNFLKRQLSPVTNTITKILEFQWKVKVCRLRLFYSSFIDM